MRLPQQPSGCCHFGADALVSLLRRCNPKLAEDLTPRMAPMEANRFAVELAKTFRDHFCRDDSSVRATEVFTQALLWFCVVSAMGYGVSVIVR